MDPIGDIATAHLSLDDEGRDLWDGLLPHLPDALTGDEDALLDALEASGRGAGLTQTVPVADLLDAYTEGSDQISELLLQAGGGDADRVVRRLQALEHVALTRLAAGFADGQQDTIQQLRRLAEAASPVDAGTGALKPEQFGQLLSLEVQRCRRRDLSLGLVEVVLEGGERARRAPVRGVAAHEVGACLRESLRRYDSMGLTQDGAFVLVLPDVSRHGLAGVAERIRRRLEACVGHEMARDLTLALAHYDLVDASAPEMLDALDRRLREAREGRQPLAWARA